MTVGAVKDNPARKSIIYGNAGTFYQAPTAVLENALIETPQEWCDYWWVASGWAVRIAVAMRGLDLHSTHESSSGERCACIQRQATSTHNACSETGSASCVRMDSAMIAARVSWNGYWVLASWEFDPACADLGTPSKKMNCVLHACTAGQGERKN